MKWPCTIKQTFILFGLVTISSCTVYTGENHLVGRVYINEETSDRIEFAENAKIVFTWTSEKEPFWLKGRAYEYYYWLDNKEIHLGGFSSSSEAFYFPYYRGRLEFSDSKEKIFFTDLNGQSGVFKKKKD